MGRGTTVVVSCFTPSKGVCVRRIVPVLTLFVLSPFVAEVLFGATPLSNLGALVVVLPASSDHRPADTHAGMLCRHAPFLWTVGSPAVVLFESDD